MKRLGTLTVFLIIFSVYLTASFLLVFKVEYISQEVNIRSGIALDLLDGNERGRQGLICSVWWTPLPTLLCLTMWMFPSAIASGAACGIISAAGGALMSVFLFKTVRYFNIPRFAGYAILIFAAFNPWMILYSSNGSSEAILLGLLAGMLWYFIRWYYDRSFSGLIGLSILASLLPLIKHQALILSLFFIFSAILVSIMREKSKLRRIEGTSFLALSPTLYTVGLWFLFNWLIMGDATYFLRGVYVNPILPEGTGEMNAVYSMLSGTGFSPAAMDSLLPFFVEFLVTPFLLAAIVLGIISFIRRPSIFILIFPGLLSMLPFYNFFMINRKQTFSITGDALVAIPVAAFIGAYFLKTCCDRKRTTGITPAMLSLFVVVLMAVGTICSYQFIAIGKTPISLNPTDHDASSIHLPFTSSKVLSREEKQVKDFILEKEPGSKIIIVGFTGYHFIAQADGGNEFMHMINLDLPRILKDTKGKLKRYILIPKPAGVAAFDDMNIEMPDFYYLGQKTIGSPDIKAHYMIESCDFDNWRVFSILTPLPNESIFGTTENTDPDYLHHQSAGRTGS